MAIKKKVDETSFDIYFDEINELFESDESQQFVYLTGAAGTGKTTLVKKLIDVPFRPNRPLLPIL